MLTSPSTMTAQERVTRWPNFTDSEMACSCCGELSPSVEFSQLMDHAQAFRTTSNKPLVISSGYRCAAHSIEAAKASPGPHSRAACDFAVQGEHAIELLQFFLQLGYVGIGVHQKGDKRYIHIDTRDTPALWTY